MNLILFLIFKKIKHRKNDVFNIYIQNKNETKNTNVNIPFLGNFMYMMTITRVMFETQFCMRILTWWGDEQTKSTGPDGGEGLSDIVYHTTGVWLDSKIE